MTNRAILLAMLQRCGGIVTIAESAEVALELLGLSSFDLIMTDLRMPEMDGFQLLMHIRAQSEHAATPIIAVTAQADAETVAACHEAGFVAHLAKPITFTSLTKALSTVFEAAVLAPTDGKQPLQLDEAQALIRMNNDSGMLQTAL